MPVFEVLLELLDDQRDVLWLDGYEDDVGVFHDLQVAEWVIANSFSGKKGYQRSQIARRPTSAFESVALAPKSAKSFLRCSLMSVAHMSLASTFCFEIKPCASASAMLPAPINPILLPILLDEGILLNCQDTDSGCGATTSACTHVTLVFCSVVEHSQSG